MITYLPHVDTEDGIKETLPHYCDLLRSLEELRKSGAYGDFDLPSSLTHDEIQTLQARLLAADPSFRVLLRQAVLYISWLRRFSREFSVLCALYAPIALKDAQDNIESIKELQRKGVINWGADYD